MVAGDWGWLRRVLDLRLETCIDSLIVDSGYRLGNSGVGGTRLGTRWDSTMLLQKPLSTRTPKTKDLGLRKLT